MHSLLQLPFVRDATVGAEMVGIPYQGAGFGFFVLLPFETGLEGLELLESRLNEPVLNRMLGSMKSQSISISLPRLDLDFKADLPEVLNGLGVCRLFDPQAVSL